jgi:hypothetical protein
MKVGFTKMKGKIASEWKKDRRRRCNWIDWIVICGGIRFIELD